MQETFHALNHPLSSKHAQVVRSVLIFRLCGVPLDPHVASVVRGTSPHAHLEHFSLTRVALDVFHAMWARIALR